MSCDRCYFCSSDTVVGLCESCDKWTDKFFTNIFKFSIVLSFICGFAFCALLVGVFGL